MAISSKSNTMDLDRLAEEELLRESERAKARCEVVGIEGFRKCPVPRANKRFLINTIVNNIKSNNIKSNNINKSQQLKERKHSLNTPRTKCDKKIVGEKTDQKGTISKKKWSSKK